MRMRMRMEMARESKGFKHVLIGSEAKHGMAALVPRRSFTVTMIMGSPVEVCADAVADAGAFFSLVLSIAQRNEKEALLYIDGEIPVFCRMELV